MRARDETSTVAYLGNQVPERRSDNVACDQGTGYSRRGGQAHGVVHEGGATTIAPLQQHIITPLEILEDVCPWGYPIRRKG